jgi:hypothetical protein
MKFSHPPFIDFDDEWHEDEFVDQLIRPWQNIPQYRILTGQSPIPMVTEESMAAGLTHSIVIWQLGLSTRAIVANIVANRYTMPLQTQVMIATAPVWLYAVNRDIIESAPEEEQQSLWQIFSQGLTGTGPGAGSWTP